MAYKAIISEMLCDIVLYHLPSLVKNALKFNYQINFFYLPDVWFSINKVLAEN